MQPIINSPNKEGKKCVDVWVVSSLHSCLMSPFTLLNESTLFFPRLVSRNWQVKANTKKNVVNCTAHIPFSILQVRFSHFFHLVGSNVFLKNSWEKAIDYVILVTIIGHGDRKRVLFLVLELSLWYGDFFLFLIGPSPAAHARTCYKDFCGCLAG